MSTNNGRILSLITLMYKSLKQNGLLTDNIRDNYDTVKENYHDILLEELDNVVSKNCKEVSEDNNV